MNEHPEPSEPLTPPAGAVPPAAPGGASTTSRPKLVLLIASVIAVGLFTVPMLMKRQPASAVADPNPVASGASCPAAQGTARLDFTVKDLKGAPVKLADYKGKVILLNFWATWCGPCKLEIPEFVDLYAEYKDKGFVILGMLTEDTPTQEELRAFMTEYRMNYPILYSQADVEDAFGPIYGIPTSFFIGRDGSICQKHMGPASKEDFERMIKSLL